MAEDSSYVRLRIRRGNTSKWKESNPVLKLGEIAADLNLQRIKVGDGVNAYNDLSYMYDELYFFVWFILKTIGNIQGSGKLLDSVTGTDDLDDIDDPEDGDIVLVKNRDEFYYYKNNSWIVLSFDDILSSKLTIVDTIQDLTKKYNKLPIGTFVFVREDLHTYIKYSEAEWAKQASSADITGHIIVESKSDIPIIEE